MIEDGAAVVVLAVALVAAIEALRTHRLRDVWSLTILAVTLVGVGAISIIDNTGLPLGDLLLGAIACDGGVRGLV